MNSPLFSIGHGNRKPEDLIKLLKDYGIQFLLDLRSVPYSKFSPEFNREMWKKQLEENGIRYVFVGENLGGRPADRTCYDDDNKVNYEKIRTKEFFKEGIKRLQSAYEKNIPVVMMCSESNPCDCHRSKLIGRVLLELNVPILHIDEKGKLKSQIMVINELNKGKSDIDLFGESDNVTSRKSYEE